MVGELVPEGRAILVAGCGLRAEHGHGVGLPLCGGYGGVFVIEVHVDVGSQDQGGVVPGRLAAGEGRVGQLDGAGAAAGFADHRGVAALAGSLVETGGLALLALGGDGYGIGVCVHLLLVLAWGVWPGRAGPVLLRRRVSRGWR